MTSPNREQECIFCAATTAGDPDESLLLLRTSDVLVMLNRYPYTNGHVMVAPTAHTGQLFEADDPTLISIIRLTAETQRILSETYQPDGFNIGMNLGAAAGAGFADHVHVHVVPRWSGDSNFMGVTGDTRVVPETLQSTLEKLRPKFEELESTLASGNE